MAQKLTFQEKVEIIRLTGEYSVSFRTVAQLFNERHPNKNISHVNVRRINKLFDETGKVTKERKRANAPENERSQAILEYFRNNPESSLRNAALNLNFTKNQIHSCLKKHKIKPFKPKFLHSLEVGDKERRMEFCLWAQGNYLEDERFLENIIFTDEATFTTNGVVSSQNIRVWSEHNPKFIINCKRQYYHKVNVFCGISKHRIIGPFFFNENLNGDRFLQFLNGPLWDTIEEIPLLERRTAYFQLDGAPIHNAAGVVNWLNRHFPNKWIGRNSPVAKWPPRSPDLTPMDFYFWGFIKNKVYKDRPRTLETLCDRIREACLEITPRQLGNTTRNLRKRLEKCIRLEGGLVEASKI